ncbi:hypothetical protein [Lentzea sp. CC55]|uniref:hypothetical protein n=1 Tax=Lentzea sp. CC55 TaxID=2884909 RepID=UPI001F2A0537|nr:hypothetical protein [Lentzea sp. CC55]MCG8925035.1 hypothetical protein [Lentzea sp. CC55]
MLRKTITALAMTATAVLLATGTAQAADAYVSTAAPAEGHGSAYWAENGDTLTVCDNEADGWGTRAYIYVPNQPNPANGTVLIKGNDPKSADGCYAYSENISETTALSIKVCLYSGATVDYCDHRRIR